MANNHISIDTTKPRSGELAEIKAYGVLFRQKLLQLQASMSQYGAAAIGDADTTITAVDDVHGTILWK